MTQHNTSEAASFHPQANIKTEGNYNDLIALWCLRILVKLKAYESVTFANLTHPKLLEITGLPENFYGNDYIFDLDAETEDPLEQLQIRLTEIENKQPKVSGVLEQNINLLGDVLKVSDAEKHLLAFTVLLQQYDALSDLFLCLEERRENLPRTLAVVLGLTRETVFSCISVDGVLFSSGMLRLLQHKDYTELAPELPDGFKGSMLSRHRSARDLLLPFFCPSPPASPLRVDLRYIRKDYRRFTDYFFDSVEFV